MPIHVQPVTGWASHESDFSHLVFGDGGLDRFLLVEVRDSLQCRAYSPSNLSPFSSDLLTLYDNTACCTNLETECAPRLFPLTNFSSLECPHPARSFFDKWLELAAQRWLNVITYLPLPNKPKWYVPFASCPQSG